MLDTIKNRKSCRKYTSELVPLEKVEKLAMMALSAPTSCNMQVFNLIYVDDKKILEQFSKSVTGKVNWTQQMFVLTVDKAITFENNANYISAGMAVQNLLIAAESMGISTCPIAGFKGKDDIKRILKIPNQLDVPLLVFFGYRDESEVSENVEIKSYRKPINDLLGINVFSGEEVFSKSSDMKHWTQSEILRYRRRILSVYYPRFRHGNWGKSFHQYLSDLEVKDNTKVLLLFPSERAEFDFLRKMGGSVSVADIIPEYIDFLSKENFVNRSILINDENKNEKYDLIICCNKLMFQKDLDSVLSFMRNNLSDNGIIRISEFSRLSLIVQCYRVLKLFGKQHDVYHNASFYKYGPFRFLGKNLLKKSIYEQGLEIVSLKPSSTDAYKSKVPKKFLWLAKAFSKIFPESVELELKIKND